MNAKSGKNTRDWRSFLSPEEREALRKIEEETRVIDARRRELTNERRLIRDRASQRWAHARARGAEPGLFGPVGGQKVDSSRQREARE